METLIQKIKNEGIKYHIHWFSGCGDDDLRNNYYEQMKELSHMTKSSRTINFDKIDSLFNTLHEEGINIFNNNKKKIVDEYLKYYRLGSLGLALFQIINIPFLVASNLAVEAYDNIYSRLYSEPRFIVSLAIEQRIKKQFKVKEDL